MKKSIKFYFSIWLIHIDDKPCIAFDVAINTELYNKNQSEIIMLTILEAVANKHGIDLAENGKIDY